MPVRLSLACGPYDRAQALISGQVRPTGLELDVRVGTDTLTRQQQIVDGEHDAGEFYMCGYIACRAKQAVPVTAIPIFVKRMFRHSYVYVNRLAGVTTPKDLEGRRVGIQSWSTTTAVWMKGILEDEYGVDLSSIQWISAGTDRYADVVPPAACRVEPLPAGESLHAWLADGRLDAAIHTGLWAPEGHPDIGFLFPDYDLLERAYYRKTGNFPIMHVLVVRDDVLREDPWVALSLYEAWQESKRRAYEVLAWQRVHLSSMWFRRLWEEEQQATNGDPYPWGFRAARSEVDQLLEYSHRQGLTADRLRPEDLFHPSTLDT